jgi:uncharacterized lipoprotein YmbA
MRAFLIAMAIVLGSCAAQRLNASIYTRTDGAPVDAAKQQAALAHCKGEAVSAPLDPQGGDLALQALESCTHQLRQPRHVGRSAPNYANLAASQPRK